MRSLQTFALAFALIWVFGGFDTAFSHPFRKQPSLSVVRERSGLSIRRHIRDEDRYGNISAADACLCSRIAEVGRQGDWLNVKRLYNKYSGFAVQVISAAMQAAYRCGKYQEAGRIYERLRRLPVDVTPISLMVGIKTYGKLNDAPRVCDIWAEIEDREWADKLRCAALIDAAAYLGDVEGAATTLDLMLARGLEPDVYNYNS